MKQLPIILLFIGFNAFSQTFEVVNKGYYYGVVGETTLPNRTTDLKALTDVQEYLDKNNLEHGEVVRPPLHVKRKKTNPIITRDTIFIEMPPKVIRDTIYINNGDISIGNQWMGEPIEIEKTPIYGKTIYDRMTSHYVPQYAFDGNIETFFHGYNINYSWVGQDYEKEVSINRFRFLPSAKAATAMLMNKALIQYSNNGTNWTTIHTITGITETNFTQWVDVTFQPVKARMFRIYATQQGSYCVTSELEFYLN